VRHAGFNPLDHCNQWGWKEGRDPSVDFDTGGYPRANPDVAAAQINPLVQYLVWGAHEGRAAEANGLWATVGRPA
jgi:serralysin